MGQHYVPQEYLRAFGDRAQPECIWLYDKSGGEPRLASIAKVAQSTAFYEQDVEIILARDVEGPGNLSLRSLRDGKTLSRQERANIAMYLGVMLKRTPYRREKNYAMYPGLWEKTMEEMRGDIRQQEVDGLISPDNAVNQLRELDAVAEKYRDEPPDGVHENILRPWPTLKMLNGLFGMAWRVVAAPGSTSFITSDNPIHFFEHLGIGREESELVFPLSPECALHGSWQGDPMSLHFLSGSSNITKEFNRRIASTAKRLAFAHERTWWVQQILQKSRPSLNLIRWQ